MKLVEKLKTTPNSKSLRIGLLIALVVLLILSLIGFYRLSKQLGMLGTDLNALSDLNFGQEASPVAIAGEALPEINFVPEGILPSWDGTSRVTILVMGLDYRDWSAGDGPARTDTMMLLTIDPLSQTAGMLSIPRDLWVSIPGFENDRINTAYFLGEVYDYPGGGPALAVKTVEQLVGVPINYYAQIDFGAFVRFIDEIGGVKIDVPEKIKIDPIVGDPVILKPERQTLYGELALAYARARNSEGGDLDRAQRQQQVIMGIRDRMLSPEALGLMISKAPVLYAELVSGIQTNMQLDEVLKLALLAQKIPEGNIERGAISITEVLLAESPDEQKILVPLPDKVREIRDEVFLTNTGTLGPLAPGTQQERMVAEAARISLRNGSLVDGMGSRTQVYLQSQGANIIEINNGEYTTITRITDYTGNPHTAKYLVELFAVTPGNYVFEYNPDSPVDITVTIGADWGTNNPMP